MKKLLIAMTAAAVGTCAWATEEQTSTLLNENFNSDWANSAELEYMTVLPEGKTLWSYSTETLGEGELKVVNDALGGKALSLNTGSKVLNAKFDAAGEVTIPAGRDTGLYFKSTVTFSDPSDTLPELGDTDKFALVVLDNIESVEEGSNTTNLWVIAGHETDGKRAYLLQPFANDDDDYNLTDSWFNTPKTIEVRAIQNVMATGNLAGFIVKVEDVICRVVKSYPIVGGVIDMSPSAAEGTTYLGYSVEEIDATYQKRYATDKTLIVSAASSSTLTSVDFQGQGVIDDVSLATTGSNFGSDAVALTFTGYDADKIASITVGGEAAVNGVYTITGSETADEQGKVAIVVTVKDGYVLKGEGWTNTGLTYTYAGYTLPTTSSAAITLNVFAPAADVNGEAVSASEFTNILESLAKKGSATYEITLSDNVATSIEVGPGQTLVLDLNGNTVADIYNDGTLTIMDSGDGGTVLNNGEYSVDNIDGEELTILGGSFNGKILGATAKGISGGKFMDLTNLDNALADGLAFSAEADDKGYYAVVEASAAPTTYAVTYTAGNFTLTKQNGEVFDEFVSGTALADYTYIFKVAAAKGYDIVSVTVGNQVATVAEDGTFSVTVNGADVAIFVTTREVKYPEAEGLVNGEVTVEVATALDGLATAFGNNEVAVTNYIEQVCGGSVDATTLVAASTAGTIGLSVDYDLPLMTAEPTVSEIAAEEATATDAAVFSFQIKVGATPIEIKKVTDNVRKMIEYGTSLNGMGALTPQDTGVALELEGNKIKVKLLKTGGTSGFMKVKLNK